MFNTKSTKQKVLEEMENGQNSDQEELLNATEEHAKEASQHSPEIREWFASEDSLIGENVTIHRGAQILEGASIGDDTTIGHNVFIGKNVKVGKGCSIQGNAFIPEGWVIEDYVFIGPGAVFCNCNRPSAKFPMKAEPLSGLIEEFSTIGANATINTGIIVKQGSLVGSGSVLTKDSTPFAILAGNPAKRIGFTCKCRNARLFNDFLTFNNQSICDSCNTLQKDTHPHNYV